MEGINISPNPIWECTLHILTAKNQNLSPMQLLMNSPLVPISMQMIQDYQASKL